ncbi:MAG: single-stranded DNA-binding protein [Clostridia bacterium]|nr:single-stranded DNA-binding protein [Clostridia bacterium]
MNKVILIGNVANDPESRTTTSGIAQCSFHLAVQRRFANASGVREADFLPVVCWRQTAEFAAKYLLKGRRVAVEGSIQTRSYDAQDGTKRHVTEIIADNLEILDRSETKPAAAETVAKAQETFGAGFVEVDDDALPF